MSTLPIAEARARLSQIVEEASATHERVEITRNGKRAAVLLGADDYDSMVETIAVLGDADLLSAHLRSMGELEAGQVLDADGLAALVAAAERRRAEG